jgi:hypothetical protein
METNPCSTKSREIKLLDVRLKVVDDLLRVFSSKIKNKLNNKERQEKNFLNTTFLPEVRYNKTDKDFFNSKAETRFTSATNKFHSTGFLSLYSKNSKNEK